MMIRVDPREAVLVKLAAIRQQRLDCDPNDTIRRDELDQLRDDLLDKLNEMRG